MSVPANVEGGFARRPHEGEALWILGGLYTYKATPQESGAYLACEVQAPDGFAIPFHFHDDEEEGFYVARGEVTIFLGEQERRLSVGGFALAPRGTRHAFRFETQDAILLLLLSPGPKHTDMFREMAVPAARHELPPAGIGKGPDELGPIGARFGTHIVGPPPQR